MCTFTNELHTALCKMPTKGGKASNSHNPNEKLC